MDILQWIAPAVLAIVFAAAAGTKLAALPRTRASFDALGVPAPRVSAIVVPFVELAVAVSTIAAPRVGGALALGLLAAFSALLSTLVAQGSTEPCACFGQVGARPVSAADLGRNAGFMTLALVAIVWPPA